MQQIDSEHSELDSTDKRQRIVVIGAGHPSGALLAKKLTDAGIHAIHYEEPSDSTKRVGLNGMPIQVLTGMGADYDKAVDFDRMVEPGSSVEGKRLRGNGRRELQMNNTGTMTWPVPKQRHRGNKR